MSRVRVLCLAPHSRASKFAYNLVKGQSHPSFFPSLPRPGRLVWKDDPHRKANSFPRQFCCINISNHISRHEKNMSAPPGPLMPLQREKVCCGGRVRWAWVQFSFPLFALTLGHTTVSPHFFSTLAFTLNSLPQLPSCGGEGEKAKRKHPGRIRL